MLLRTPWKHCLEETHANLEVALWRPQSTSANCPHESRKWCRWPLREVMWCCLTTVSRACGWCPLGRLDQECPGFTRAQCKPRLTSARRCRMSSGQNNQNIAVGYASVHLVGKRSRKAVVSRIGRHRRPERRSLVECRQCLGNGHQIPAWKTISAPSTGRYCPRATGQWDSTALHRATACSRSRCFAFNSQRSVRSAPDRTITNRGRRTRFGRQVGPAVSSTNSLVAGHIISRRFSMIGSDIESPGPLYFKATEVRPGNLLEKPKLSPFRPRLERQ